MRPGPDDEDSQNTLPSSEVSALATQTEGRSPPAPGAHLASQLKAGNPLGPYRLIRLLGQGGFGQVWEAENLDNGRRVALKVLTAMQAGSAEIQQRFEREGRLAASLNHPNCVYVFGAEQAGSYPAIAMELMQLGTLQDRLNRSGPIPWQKAVDQILDVIAGLEAANEAGIIHRDVKPSNCFVDAAGRVKIGDFGLSKMLEMDSQLTVEGSFMGTPSYASPEQVKGREIDFRSDIYSVGATLYALLAGKPPFEAPRVGEVLARILSEEPAPFSKHSVAVPHGLEQLAVRALAKDKEKRFSSYAAFRAALLPFSSQALSTASLARRFAAYLIDQALFVPITYLFGLQVITQSQGLTFALQGSAISGVLTFVLQFLYFFITERLWGRGVGKQLLGLKVTTASGAPLSTRQALFRTTVFMTLMFLPALFSNLFIAATGTLAASKAVGALEGLKVLCYLAMLSTMRRRNGYAGAHELASRTRVLAMVARTSVRVPKQESPVSPWEEGIPALLGPYRIQGVVWSRSSDQLLVGHDELLDRQVWIHRFEDACPARPIFWLAGRQPGRLHWLQGSRQAGNCWDAYEKPAGSSLVEWVRSRGRLSWQEMGGILLQRAQTLKLESEDSMESADSPGWSLDHVWIDAYGQVKLLDFPALPEPDRKSDAVSAGEWRQALHQLGLFGLEGRRIKPEDLRTDPPRVPLPEYARLVMEGLCVKGTSTLQEVIDQLEAAAGRLARVGRGRRVLLALMAAAPPLLTVMVILLGIFAVSLSSPWFRDLLNAQEYVQVLGQLEKRTDSSEARRQQEAVKIVLSAMVQQSTQSGSLGEKILAKSPKTWETIKAAARDYPQPTQAQVAEALPIARSLLQQDSLDQLWSSLPKSVLSVATVSMAIGGLLSILLSWFFRGGPLLHLFGITLQTHDGRRAGAGRCLLRALMAWGLFLPFLPFWPQQKLLSMLGWSAGTWSVVQVVFLLLGIGCLIYGLLSPERGVADRIAGTHQVLR